MYCFCSNDKDKINGVFIKHSDYLYSNMKELKTAVNVQNLELNILQKIIQLLIAQRYKELDPIVGDCKCQTRVSILLDIFQQKQFSKNYCDIIQKHLDSAKNHLQNFINQLDIKNVTEIKSIMKTFYGKKISEIFKENNLNADFSDEILIMSLCFLLFFQHDKIVTFSDNLLSSSKSKDLLLMAKKNLIEISIHYEQSLAEKYGTDDDKQILNDIEINGFAKMTAFYPSFKIIFDKIKIKKQYILIKKIIFCECGGIQAIENGLYETNKNNKLEKISLKHEHNVVAVIQGYQFKGTFLELKKIINLPIDSYNVDINLFKLCTCQKHLDIPKIENIEDVILASFAQHDQFTNKAEIDWQGLGLENSNLKKEYDRLKNIPGCSLDDMSIFRIIHIYASTVGQELEDQRELLAKLGKK